MGNHCLGIAALLLSLTGGMFLLAKTKKDALGTFFNVISWFIIVVSLVAMLCCGIRCAAGRMCGQRMDCHQGNGMMMRGGDCDMMGGGECHERMFMKRMMHEGMGGENAGGCMSGEMGDHKMNCCAGGGEKKMCVKDSVVIKK